jgi:putative SOS response-associated peptidase YedK
MRRIHNRMPVILKWSAEDAWLDPPARPEHLAALLTPYPSDEMTAYAVSPLFSSPRNDSPEVVAPVSAGPRLLF